MASNVEGLRDFQAQAFPSWRAMEPSGGGRKAERPLRLAIGGRRRIAQQSGDRLAVADAFAVLVIESIPVLGQLPEVGIVPSFAAPHVVRMGVPQGHNQEHTSQE